MGFLDKIFGNSGQRSLKEIQPLVEIINRLESEIEKLRPDEFPKKTEEFKKRVQGGESLDDILPEAFALVREAAKRTLGQRHYDVQLLGGITLHKGRIAEMKTGEGKTLVATLPVYLNALSGKGVHIVTVNDYLARRDVVWMGPIYNYLGLKTACLNHQASYIYDPEFGVEEHEDGAKSTTASFLVHHEFLRPIGRREAYRADILYGTNNEFGFDYLKDNLVYDQEQIVQRTEKEGGFNYAIIDEVDSILIDEARTPLIISAPSKESDEFYRSFASIAGKLEEGKDYNLDEKMRAVMITDEGISKVEKILGVENIYSEKGIKYVHHLEQALKAKALFHRDKDYIVRDGEVIIVDEFTGRLMPGRRWSEGLHQAIEAKEGVKIQEESKTYATITFQNYFRMYKKLAGMTGTALTSSEEFYKVYGLEVSVIPTNRPMIRKDHPDKIFQTEKGKYRALIREIKERHSRGQPILVGTISIEKNELISALLKKEGIPHQVLNAKQHENEAKIIAQAGKLGAVTIATNMAGRGVDIILGGNPSTPEEAQKVKELGGLFVVGTERHEARRIDNQLRGRAGRQGDPGESQFFISLEDDLMRIFGSDKIKAMMGRFGIPEDEAIENKFVSRAIESAQEKIEGFNFDTRKHLLQYDDVMNKQRQAIYQKRREILFASGEELERIILGYLKDEIRAIIHFHAAGELTQQWNLEEIFENFRSRFETPDESPQSIDDVRQKLTEIKNTAQNADSAREEMIDYLNDYIEEKFKERKKEKGEEILKIWRNLLLQIIDMLWVGHLESMEYMRSSVGLRAYGQLDPLVEYKNEGARMFRELNAAFQTHLSHSLFKVGQPALAEKQWFQEKHPGARVLGKTQADEGSRGEPATVSASKKKIGRNDPCPCGSGKKYKKCHGK